MRSTSSQSNPVRETHALHVHALDDLRYIRRTMERASAFTAVPGWGGVLVGCTALLAARIAASQSRTETWLMIWLAEALLAAIVGLAGMFRKARAVQIPVLRGAGRKFLFGLGPPMIAGAILTVALYEAGFSTSIPGMWLLMYGVGAVSAGTFSVRIVPVMGLCFMALGTLTLLAPESWIDLLMAMGFGGLHVIFGFVIARRHGG